MEHTILTLGESHLRETRTSVKWRAHPADVLPLFIAEMDADPAPAVVSAVTDAIRRGDTGYALPQSYAASFADYAAAQWDWRPDTSASTMVADVLTGISHLVRHLTDAGGAVILSSPVYNAFYSVIESVGRRAVDVPLTPAGRLDIDAMDEVFATCTGGGGRAVYLLSNPHNPTGSVHTAEELGALAAVANRHGVRVLSDEIHAPLVYDSSTFTPFLSVPGSERGFLITSASKAWNLAGLKAAVVIPGAEAVQVVREFHPFLTYGASHFGVIAQMAAWDSGREWMDRLRGELDANRHLLAELVAQHLPGARFTMPESTYLGWVDCRPLGMGDNPAATFLAEGRVALSAGPEFGAHGVGGVRINFATSVPILREALERLGTCLR